MMPHLKDRKESILLAIVYESEGPHGYHLNGDLAFWEEFPEVEEAERVINKALGKDNK